MSTFNIWILFCYYYLPFLFFVCVCYLIFNCQNEILFLLSNPNYIFNLLNKRESIIVNNCYIIHDNSNKDRLENIIQIKDNLDMNIKLFNGIFPQNDNWNDLYTKYVSIYPSLRTDDRRSHGCFLSHILILEELRCSNLTYGLILEDNVSVLRSIPNTFVLPIDFDILSIERDRLGGLFYDNNLIRVTNGCGACGYIVKISSIDLILDGLRKLNFPIDLCYVHLSFLNMINFYNMRDGYVLRSSLESVRKYY